MAIPSMDDVMLGAMTTVEATNRARLVQWQFRETFRLATGIALPAKVECKGWFPSATIVREDQSGALFVIEPRGLAVQTVFHAQELPDGHWGLYAPATDREPACITVVRERPTGVELVPWQYIPTVETPKPAAPCSTG